jgi:nucleoside-diphosphate-sugar epimerase
LEFLIIGCGFTGSRVADRLESRGARVTRLHRAQVDLRWPHAPERLRNFAPLGCAVLHSAPPVDGGGDRTALSALSGLASRIVYLSSTSVYGDAEYVDHTTPVTPGSARLSTEQAVLDGPWSSLVLRPAAIYGPGRGAHVSIQAGTFRLFEDGRNYVSRIHVDDLAALAEAALLGDASGAWPVADEEPCESREIAAFCSKMLRVPMPPSATASELPRTRRANRRVDGSAIRRLLGVSLRYPSYRVGIPAALAESGVK